jgi:hypothetical protein
MQTSHAVAVLTLLIAMIISAPGRADQYYSFVTVTCAPNIGFFALQTYAIDNPKDGALEANNEIHTTGELEQTPQICTIIDGVRIIVRGSCNGCGPGIGPNPGEIALFVNDEILPLPTDVVNWILVETRRYFVRHSIEIVAGRPYGREAPRLNVVICESPEIASIRDEYPLTHRATANNPEWRALDTRCRAFEKILPIK